MHGREKGSLSRHRWSAPVRRYAWALGGGLAAACLLAAPSWSKERCGWSGYSYAGIESAQRAHGIAATVEALSPPHVESGHVAAWVGVGGEGAGPRGRDEWLQVGLVSFSGSASALYYELQQPGTQRRYVELRAHVAPGARYRVAVLEIAARRDWWRVWVDGRAVSGPIFLPGSHAAWEPIATAESWDGGMPACNRYAYRFERVVVATRPGGGWRPLAQSYVLQDRGYRVIRRSPATFVATVRPPATPEARA